MADPTGSPRMPRARPRLVTRVLLALTTGTALLGVVAVVGAAAIVPPVGARRVARTTAQREMRAQLARDEGVIASAFASQRRWTDMYRESFGVVVATGSRVLYVGMPPTPLLRPREDGPDELLVESYPYADDVTLAPRSLFRGRVRGLTLTTPIVAVDFLVDDPDWIDALRVMSAASAARGEARRRIPAPLDSAP